MVKKSSMTQERIDLLEEVAKSVVDLMKDVPLEIEGTPTAALKFSDGKYKQKPVPTDTMYFIKEAYLGKRGEIIFGLAPEDSLDFETVEFTTSAIDQIVPLAGPALADRSHFEDQADEDFKMVFEKLVIRRGEEILQQEVADQFVYEDNPNFGKF